MKFSRIDHVALEVADLQHSADFYSKHFGFKHYFDQTTPAGLKIGYLSSAPRFSSWLARSLSKEWPASIFA